MTEMRNLHGDLIYFHRPIHTFFAFHPNDIRDVLLKYASQTIKGAQSNHLRAVIGEGIFTSEGQVWRDKRRLIGKLFNANILTQYRATVIECAERHMSSWPTDVDFDLSNAIGNLTFEIAGRLFFGGIDAAEAPVIKEIVEFAGTLLFEKIGSLLNVPYWIPTAKHRRFIFGMRRLDKLIYRLIAERRSSGIEHFDYLGRLLSDVASLSDSQIRDEAVTVMIAGFETISTMMNWTIHLLGLHPSYQEVIRHNPEFATSFLKESMRLYPPSPIISRQTTTPIELSGVSIAAGTNIVMSQYITHRDPRFWVQPEKFRPERFEGGEEIHKYAFFPFSQGPRRCIGEELAYIEATTILEVLLRRFHLQIDAIDRLPVCEIIMRPDRAVRARLVER
jgi:cytochrome P450